MTHGRDCRCTPCRAEDWDAVEAGIAAEISAVTRPAENQQTVEAALDNLLAILEAAEHEGRWHLSGRDVINMAEAVRTCSAALRDLVAQAADARAALIELRETAAPRDWETPGHPMNEWTKREPILRKIDHALARLDGAR